MSGFVVTSLRHAAYDARTIYEEPSMPQNGCGGGELG